MPRTMTLRLTDEQAATLDLVARADDQTVSEAVRTAIDAHIEERRRDEDFKERLRRRQEDERELYKRLSE